MKKTLKASAGVSLCALLSVPSAHAAESPKVSHEALICVPATTNAKVSARVSSASTLSGVRLYFRSSPEKAEYFLQMRGGDASEYWAVLPVPAEKTTSVQYRLVGTDQDGREGTAGPFVANVSPTCRVTLSDEERRYAANLVVGLTTAGQSGRPDGFLCGGLVSQISASGEMKANDDCRRGSSALLAVAGGAAAAAAGGVAISHDGGGRTSPPVSPSDRPQQ